MKNAETISWTNLVKSSGSHLKFLVTIYCYQLRRFPELDKFDSSLDKLNWGLSMESKTVTSCHSALPIRLNHQTHKQLELEIK